MEEDYKIIDHYLMIRLPEEIDHHSCSVICRRADHMMLDNSVSHIVFDFSDTKFMDSSGIGLVMGRYKICESMGASLEIHGLSRHAYKVMCLAGLQNLAVLKKKKEADKSETA